MAHVPELLKEEDDREKMVIESVEKKRDESNEKVEAKETKVDEGKEMKVDSPVENKPSVSENANHQEEQQNEPQEKKPETKPSETTPNERAIHSESPSVEEEVESNSYCCCVYSSIS